MTMSCKPSFDNTPWDFETSHSLDFTDAEINQELNASVLKIDELQMNINNYLSDTSQEISLDPVVKHGIDLIDEYRLYHTSIYAPFDVIIHRVNTCILKRWCGTELPFQEWKEQNLNGKNSKWWDYLDYRTCSPGILLVDNYYLCIESEALGSPSLRDDLTALLKENTKIAEVYLSGTNSPVILSLKEWLKDNFKLKIIANPANYF